MKLIRFGLISLLILFLLMTAISLMFPSTVIVSRAIDIHGNKDSVANYIRDVHKWKQWMIGITDSNTTILDNRTIHLNGIKVFILPYSKQDTVLTSEWISKNGKLQTSSISLYGNKENGLVVVQWQFIETLHWYPWEKFGSMMNDKFLGAMMEDNLQSLKKKVEATHP